MGHQTRRKRNRPTHQKPMKSFCHIPIPPLASTYSSLEVGRDFYGLVNNEWISKVSVPLFENDFGASEELERCIFRESSKILMGMKHKRTSSVFKSLAESCLATAADVQQNSVEYLKRILASVNCIETKEDVVKHFAALAHAQLPSVFKYRYSILPNRKTHVCISSGLELLPLAYYSNYEKSEKYKALLNTVGDLFGISNLSYVYELEKSLIANQENMWSDTDLSAKGSALISKFPGIPWTTWFKNSGDEMATSWKALKIWYTSPRWIRFVGKMLNVVSPHYWKLVIARIYIVHALPYLPAPFDDIHYEFFGKFIQGQRQKAPRMELLVNTVYTYLPDTFSEIFWKENGDTSLPKEADDFAKTLVEAAKKRIDGTDWMGQQTKAAAIEKVEKMAIEMVRPGKWPVLRLPRLDSQNFLKNIHELGSWNTSVLFERMGKTYDFWEEGIFRVNAYYFNETNEIIIPYGTFQSPFYSSDASPAWNYGGIGATIGHEMCHGFDEDGRKFSAKGEMKNWWTRADDAAYRKKSEGLIRLYSKQTVGGKHIHGKKTLSENIADLGGIAIALEALKESHLARGLDAHQRVKEYREFFVSYATSWRTKYRPEKLESSIGVDFHAPAFLRVNLIVAQFDEWYEAFGVSEGSPLFIDPAHRIRIF